MTAQCKVTVRKAPSTAALSASALTLGVGESYRFYCTIPDGTAARVRTYSVSNTKVLTISGGTITAKSTGTATVTVKLFNGVTAQCKVTVRKAPSTVSLNHRELAMGIGESTTLKATLPSGTASYHKTFSVSNRGVLSCDANGQLKALSEGTATVTVKLFNGVTAQCNVTVAPPPQYLGVADDLAVLYIGETFRLTPQNENGTTYSGVTYTSGDKRVATVTQDGLVRAVGAGTTDITLKTYNGRAAKAAVIVYDSGIISSFPSLDETARYLNQATLRPMKTNCPQLDSLVSSILSRVTTGTMTTAEKVQAVYDYLTRNSTYGYGYIPVELPGIYRHDSDYWIVTSAYPLLKNHVGTCENFSAALTVLLRRIGLEANSVYGQVGLSAGGKGGHYWTDVVLGGKHYIFDAQVENNTLGGSTVVPHYWYGMKPEYNFHHYEYRELIPVIDFSYD